MELGWLIPLFERHERDDVEDLIATFLLSTGFNPKGTPPVLLGIVDGFARRAGVEPGEARADSEQKIRAYLEARPINPELRIELEQGIRGSIAGSGTKAIVEAFARFADRDLGKRAFDGKRPEGTRPGYLALLAHDDIDE